MESRLNELDGRALRVGDGEGIGRGSRSRAGNLPMKDVGRGEANGSETSDMAPRFVPGESVPTRLSGWLIKERGVGGQGRDVVDGD